MLHVNVDTQMFSIGIVSGLYSHCITDSRGMGTGHLGPFMISRLSFGCDDWLICAYISNDATRQSMTSHHDVVLFFTFLRLMEYVVVDVAIIYDIALCE